MALRSGPTIASPNVAIHYPASSHPEPTKPSLATTTTAPPTTTNTTSNGSSDSSGTTTTTVGPAGGRRKRQAVPLYSSTTGTDGDTIVTSYEKVLVFQVSLNPPFHHNTSTPSPCTSL